MRRPVGIVGLNPHRAARSTAFEPVVKAAVNLHELAYTRSAMPRLLEALAAVAASRPEAVGDHPLTQRLNAGASPCSSTSFTWANVGPKSGYSDRTMASACRRTSSGVARLLRRPRRFEVSSPAPSAA